MNGSKYKKNSDLTMKMKELNKTEMMQIRRKTIGNYHLKKI
jgi:hypothetical protein